ncbi:MAG: exo-alpha-sialidase [Clostridia bacterium]|nr:exo-alpha-sialidase [Clostridia bacterium]
MLEKIKDIVIYKDGNYNSFPNAIVLGDGTIMVGFRHAPDWQSQFNDVTHLDPASAGVYVLSKDNAETWSDSPSLIYRHFFYGVQDPCLNRLFDGTIMGTFFMWKVSERDKPLENPDRHHFVNDYYSAEMMNAHTIRSHDGGLSWDEPACIDYSGKDGLRASVRGNCIGLLDSSILLGLAIYDHDTTKRFVRIVKSMDRGLTWEKVYDIRHRDNHVMGEPNLFRTKSGKLVCFMRTHIDIPGRNVYDDGNSEMSPMHVSYSYDNGATWSEPEKTQYTSPSPFHALQLDSGNVLLSYGHRYSPYGIKVVLLDGELENIHSARPVLIRSDGVNHDLGYTSSVQMPDGNILVTYYIFHKNDTTRYIAGTVLRES